MTACQHAPSKTLRSRESAREIKIPLGIALSQPWQRADAICGEWQAYTVQGNHTATRVRVDVRLTVHSEKASAETFSPQNVWRLSKSCGGPRGRKKKEQK